MSGVCDFLEVVAGCRVPAPELTLDIEVQECRDCGCEIREPHVFWKVKDGPYCRQCAYRDHEP